MDNSQLPIVYFNNIAGYREGESPDSDLTGMRIVLEGVYQHHTLRKRELDMHRNVVTTSRVNRIKLGDNGTIDEIETMNTLYVRRVRSKHD